MSNLRVLSLLVALAFLPACAGDPDPEPSPSPTEQAGEASPGYSPSPLPSPTPFPRPAETTPSPLALPTPDPVAEPSPNPSPAATGPAAAGAHIFSQSGRVSLTGCLTSDQPLPGEVKVTATAPDGSRQQLIRETVGDSSVRSVFGLSLQYRAEGAYLLALRQSQTLALQTLAFEFTANPPVLIIPAYPVVGQQLPFVLTSSDGKVTMQATVTVEAVDEPVTLGDGSVMPAHRLRSVSAVRGVTSQGSIDVEITRVSWYSPENHLEIKDTTDITGTLGLCSLTSKAQSLAREF